MLAKEFKETLKQAIFLLQLILIMPVILLPLLKISFFDIFFPIFQIGLLFFSLLMGNFMFSLDREQRGMEYLLSLPYSRMQLLGYKFCPRMGAVVFFYLIHLLIYNWGGNNAAALPLFGFTLLYTSLFLIAFSFSTVSENFVLSSAVSALFLFIYMFLLMLVFKSVWLLKSIPLFPDLYLFGFLFSGSTYIYKPFFVWSVSLIMLAAFSAAFVRAFKSFDIRPARIYNKKLFIKLLVWLPVGFILSVLIVYLGTKINFHINYHLTQQNILLEKQWRYIDIYSKDKNTRLETNLRLWPLIEKDNIIISGLETDFWDQDNKYLLCKLEPGKGKIEPIYETTYKKMGFPYFVTFENEVIFFEKGKKPTEYELVFLDIGSTKTERLSIQLPEERSHSPRLIGTDKIAGLRFWLVALRIRQTHTVFQVWETGLIENLGESLSHRSPLFINRMLFTYAEKNINISRFSPDGLEPISELPGNNLSFYLSRQDLANYPLTELYGRQDQKIIRLDLKSLKLEELGRFSGRIRNFYPGKNYFLELRAEEEIQKIYALENGQMHFLMEHPFRDPKKTSVKADSVFIFKTGIVTRSKGRTKVFSLPDLKELKFKGLSP